MNPQCCDSHDRHRLMTDHCCIVCAGGFSGARDEGQGRWGREASAPVAQVPSEALSGESIHVHAAVASVTTLRECIFTSSPTASVLEERALLMPSRNDQVPLPRCCEHVYTQNVLFSERHSV